MSVAWSQFENDFLNANSWGQRKDGFPSDLLDALDVEEKRQAVKILIGKLDGRDDWPIRAMAHLRVKESIAMLRSLLSETKSPVIRAVTATAVYELTGDDTMENEVITVCTMSDLHWGYRIDAIHCLARFKTESARHVLDELTRDSDYLVSYNAKIARGGSRFLE